MITKGILKSINYNDNTCLVRLPLFETAGADTEVVLKAVFLTQPGNYNGYIENDVVFVDFENNKLDAPVVIGKLYLGAVKEAQSTANASINVSNLTVTSKAILPLDTKIINTKPTTSAIVDVDGDVYSYSSLEDILKAIRKTESSISDLHFQNSDSIAKIETLYLSQEAGLEAPSASDNNWNISMPKFQEGYSIWQKTTTYNNSGQILNYEIICLSDLATVSSYWLKCNSMIHSGTQQKDSLKVTAMVKLGSATETEDTTAVLAYKWQSDPNWTKLETPLSYEFEITSDACRNEDLLIKAYHGTTEYETETIKFISQNGPTLVLSNYSAQIEYDSTGNNKIELNATVSSEAELYYNGKLVEDFTDYKWILNGCKASQNSEATEITTKTITISELIASSATATCNVTYNGTPCTATFTITKARQGHTPYALHIENDFVSIATNSSGDLLDDSWKQRTTHTVVVTRDNTKQAIRIYDSSATNITERIYIKATKTNVECSFSESSTTDNEVTLSALTGSEGTINYILYEKSGDTEIALASATFKVVKIIPGKDGKDGASGITYWLVSSANTHLGTQQDTAITITAMTKSGDTKEAIDNTAKLAWRFKGSAWSTLTSSSITISTFENKDIEVIATHGDTIDSDPSLTDEGIYEFETITYAPLNTPVLDLSNDSAAISYYWETNPNPTIPAELKKSNESDTVSSTATVYLNGEILTEDVTYSWSPIYDGITTSNVTDDDKTIGSQITVSELTANTVEFKCTATINAKNIFKNEIKLEKVFTVVKQIQGNSVTDYWLKVSTPIHTGSTNLSEITITAMKREGTDGTEKVDPQAFIWYRWNKEGSDWTLVPDTNTDDTIAEHCTFTIAKKAIEDADLEIIATHTPETTNFNNLSEEDKYDSETITYSPATTPVIDLSQDKSDLNYADNTKLDPDETETCTARLYLNGVDISSQANWTIESTDCTASLNNTTATVEAINDGSLKGTVTFKATIKSDATNGAEKYKGESYTKTFTITKKLKGDKGDKGENATSYWLSISSPVHTGTKQADDIKIQALTQVGETGTVEPVDVYFQVTGVASDFILTNPTTEITIPADKVLDQNIKIKASFNADLSNCFEEETITYSPLNTPILDLDNDSDFLAYNSSGVKLGEAKVSSTPTVYFNGEAVTAPGTFTWTVYKIDDSTGAEDEIYPTEADVWEISNNTISISKISTNNVKAVCAIDYVWNNRTTHLEKVFSVTKQIQGEDAIDYYLNVSSFIHTGEAQTSNVLIEAKKRKGVSGPEELDTDAHLYWRYINKSTWTEVTGGKLTLSAPFENQDIELIAAREPLESNISSSNEKVYEVETITYSPLNTPVVDLSNDTDDLSYDATGTTKIDNTEKVTSTARLYLNGKEVTSNITYKWEIPEGVTATDENTKTINISGISSQSVTIPCTITVGENGINGKFVGLSYSKDFIVTKKLKGDNGFNTISLHIENDRDSVPCTSDGNPPSDYAWEAQTTHTITAFDGVTPITFTTVTKTVPTTDSENYTLVYEDEGVGYKPGTTSNILNYVASITGLNADTGKVIYKLYKGKTLLDSVSFVITKNKAGADGDDLSDHYVQANVDTIKYDPKATPSYSTTEIIFNFYSQVGLNEPTGLTLSKAYYTTTVDGGKESIKTNITKAIKEAGLAVTAGTDFKQSYTVTLYDSKEEFLDSETVSIIANGTGAMSCVVESSAGTSFKKPFGDRTTTLTAHLYEGTEELDTNREWFYEWYWFNNTKSGDQPTVIERSDENNELDEEGKVKSYMIKLKLSDLINQSVYFIAYPDGKPAEGTEVAILNVARLGLMSLGK